MFKKKKKNAKYRSKYRLKKDSLKPVTENKYHPINHIP